MKSQKQPKNRTLQQGIALVILIAVSIATWFKNEEKSSNPSTEQAVEKVKSQPNLPSEIVVPAHLGNFDTIMANDHLGQNKNAHVDYFMLVLSWSPSFCENQKSKNGGKIPSHLQFQCNQAAERGWVIHGLWAQNEKAKKVSDHPRFCQGDLPPLPEALIKQYMPEAPGASLLQGQWEKHGACAFENAEQYFAKQKALFKSLNLPGQVLSRSALFEWMKKFNPSLRNVYLGASRNELYICYDKQWNVMDCPR